MGNRKKLIQLIEVESELAVTVDRQKGIINFDIDNGYPQRMRKLANASGRASQCINTRGRFVRGRGFQDKIFYKSKVNKSLTNDKLLRKATEDYSLHRGFAVHVNYNALGQKTSLSFIPFENCRLSVTDKDEKMINGIKTHPDWTRESSRNFDSNDIRFYDFYNPDPKVVFDQAMRAGGFSKWRGQMFWFSADGPMKYPLSSFHAVMKDVSADGEAQAFRQKNITTNFMASYFLIVDEFEDPQEEIDFINNLRKFQGASQASKIMVIPKAKNGQTFELKKVDIQDVDELFSHTETSVKESIRGNYLMPAVLVSDLVSGKLGTSTEIKDATSFYNGITEDDRIIFEEVWTELFNNWKDPFLNPSRNYSIEPLSFTFEKEPVAPLIVAAPGALPGPAPAQPLPAPPVPAPSQPGT